MTYTLANDAALLTPTVIGEIPVANRLFMAPLTRSRADADATPADISVTYYGQRASAGLVITEATAVSAAANGAYLNTPGLYTDAHADAWARIAEAVHDGGGRIVAQLWHVGRMAHPEISGSDDVVGPSAVAADAEAHTPSGKKPLPVPRALETDEIAGIVADFRRAARRAVDAGLDGVEIHGANGYLLHEFLADGSNRRTDRYGGSPENRARFAAEVIEAVAEEIGAGRVGVRLSPGGGAGDVTETDPVSAYRALSERIAPLGIAYVHLLIGPEADTFAELRSLWTSALILNTGFAHESSVEELETLVTDGTAEAVAVGRWWLANPDLVDRLTLGAELNEPDQATFYVPGPTGYIDYPTLAQAAAGSTAGATG